MFGIDDMLLFSLLGAGTGALTNKKNPLKGAAIGGALGAGGGLLGGAGAAAAPTSQAGLLAAQEAGLGSAAMGWGGATTGTQGMLNGALGSEIGAGVGGFLGKAEKPAMAALQGAQVAQSMTPPEQPIVPGQIQKQPVDMTGLLNQSAQQQQMEMEEQERRRQQMQQYMMRIR